LHVLLDKNVPSGVKRILRGHRVELAEDRGWARISNGALIQTAERAGFDVVVTADQNIVYQQNLKGRKVALVVLGSNIWPIVREHRAAIAEQIRLLEAGGYVFLEMPLPLERPRRN
jgi:hypothetical protein